MSLFSQQLFQGNNRKNILVPHYRPFVREIHCSAVVSSHKGPVIGKVCSYYDIIMIQAYQWNLITNNVIKGKSVEENVVTVISLKDHKNIKWASYSEIISGANVTRIQNPCTSVKNSKRDSYKKKNQLNHRGRHMLKLIVELIDFAEIFFPFSSMCLWIMY